MNAALGNLQLARATAKTRSAHIDLRKPEKMNAEVMQNGPDMQTIQCINEKHWFHLRILASA